ncbi:hypothetical protein ACFY5J_10475 [Peribacillus butanolivorans]|uniref:hypothetical protein n=1 Tax=Peribacillus butanolivorans TaxID=421767 RepID=UPI0006F5A99F|nr:hypothetical protein ASG65_08730 [Bacillus sp. Leaf13]KRF55323.1 hypothetical protein ASG99_11430 [Bacillus sp. Soil768D1]
MTRIPEDDRNMIEKAIYLPMVITVLNRDLKVIEISPFKLKRPYSELVEHVLKAVQEELAEVRRYLRKENIKVSEIKRDESFTMYCFLYKGYEEHHNYFNPRLRNKTEDLLCNYFFERSHRSKEV